MGTLRHYLLRHILMQISVFDPALSLAEAALAKSYSARNLSPRPNAWRNVWRQYSFFWFDFGG
eukprot:COSAG02_NODE_632_length_19286_cov_1518.762235_15_plen_63_part_00